MPHKIDGHGAPDAVAREVGPIEFPSVPTVLERNDFTHVRRHRTVGIFRHDKRTRDIRPIMEIIQKRKPEPPRIGGKLKVELHRFILERGHRDPFLVEVMLDLFALDKHFGTFFFSQRIRVNRLHTVPVDDDVALHRLALMIDKAYVLGNACAVASKHITVKFPGIPAVLERLDLPHIGYDRAARLLFDHERTRDIRPVVVVTAYREPEPTDVRIEFEFEVQRLILKRRHFYGIFENYPARRADLCARRVIAPRAHGRVRFFRAVL